VVRLCGGAGGSGGEVEREVFDRIYRIARIRTAHYGDRYGNAGPFIVGEENKIPRGLLVGIFLLSGICLAGLYYLGRLYDREVSTPALDEVDRYATTDIFLLGERNSFVGLRQDLDSGALSYTFSLGEMSAADYFSTVRAAAEERGWGLLHSSENEAVYIAPDSVPLHREVVRVSYEARDNRVLFELRRATRQENGEDLDLG
jgi:hypothetical protein